MSQKAPKTVALLCQLARIKTIRNWTYSDVLDRINEHLEGDKLRNDRATRNQVSRWMRYEHAGWMEPRAEIILAIQSLVAQS